MAGPQKLAGIEALRDALERVRQWHADPGSEIACPLCGASGLAIIDRSARPYAEWYALRCEACGLDDSINVPMGPATRGGD